MAERTPGSQVASRLRTVAGRSFALEPSWIAGEVGCGPQISAPDTVPHAIWCAARHLNDLEEALLGNGLGRRRRRHHLRDRRGDRGHPDRHGRNPRHWLQACETLPA